MKKKFLFLLLIQVVFVSCQKKITDLKLISYDERSNNELKINAFSTLDKDGVLLVYLDRQRDNVFYKYKLSQSEIDQINTLASKKLENYVIKKSLDLNQGYAGSRNFISFKVNGKEDKICFIKPFMDSDFNKIIDSLEDKIYKQEDSQRTEAFQIDFKKTEKEIANQNQINNYLPSKSLPPPPMR
ncbi:hypothetical protein BBI01_17980 [Chryseobacterium artocarpi]|uniref:Lipoprotein n=1 Tax=Chryseobacterium artocarpi TaxID=1414727 RepID=A0A1B8ZBX2_9FLAO|nr:hypothetical protein [Chryseobacterium artocarpi]OCA69099.1 hypothetical protein BBI01_17980 [Chryseobacterium artocarpi]